MSMGHRPHVTFLLDKPLRMSSVIAHVIQRLHRQVPMITVYRPIPDSDLPPRVLQSGLVVQRGLLANELATAIQLEQASVPCVNSAVATRNLGDRTVMMSLLAAAALPIPRTFTAHFWKDVVEITCKRPVAVKALDGRIGRGQHVLLAADGNLPVQPPCGGPFILQEYVPLQCDGTQAVYRGEPHQSFHQGYGSVIVARSGYANRDRSSHLARHAGAAVGMEIYGVDFLYDLNGPKIIDVNPFPGFRNVPYAARLIANHLSEIVMTSREGVLGWQGGSARALLRTSGTP